MFAKYRLVAPILVVLTAIAASPCSAQTTSAILEEANPQITARQYREMIQRAVEYLRLRGQAADGSFSSSAGIGPTGLVATGLLSVGVPADDPVAAKALKFIESHIQPSGGIHTVDSIHRNYDTCIAIMALSSANQDEKYKPVLAKAEAFVKGLQWDEGEGKDPSNTEYGGAGYGSHSRPDMSNTTFLIEALKALGNDEEDEAIQKALIFVSRCQNLEGPYNTTEHAAKIDDGGFYYTVAAGGETKAGTEPNGGLRSYGSMTYAGLKSMIYAGLGADDRRVAAATDFIRKHYDLESNPGMGQQGLFYYYHTMAKALSALGTDQFVDEQGTAHPWKSELAAKLYALQAKDGSWVNETTRWMEGDPNLVCGYALMALAYCEPQ